MARDSEQWQIGTALWQNHHGKVMKELVQFQDFSLFHLSPQQGLFVKGFVQA
ncbi:hypothetical protein L5B71_07325 [Avibacterium sp. 21-586]|uniref:hypothetical protein n=1 Tax=Avibacterium sp. 21-586 TaxID=2911534 RepID=UPI002246FEDB|nr:hypothetical protein [Avibacterium sp. 21-586]MCW9710658.1 hypothetical protein [Avibacterium sp. 21-586]